MASNRCARIRSAWGLALLFTILLLAAAEATQLSLSQKSELAMGMSLGVCSRRHQLGRC